MSKQITYRNKLHLPNVINCTILSEDNKYILVRIGDEKDKDSSLIIINKTNIISIKDSVIEKETKKWKIYY